MDPHVFYDPPEEFVKKFVVDPDPDFRTRINRGGDNLRGIRGDGSERVVGKAGLDTQIRDDNVAADVSSSRSGNQAQSRQGKQRDGVFHGDLPETPRQSRGRVMMVRQTLRGRRAGPDDTG